MTDMKRITISFSKDAEMAVEAVRSSAEKPISHSEAVRRLILRGYEALKREKTAEAAK